MHDGIHDRMHDRKSKPDGASPFGPPRRNKPQTSEFWTSRA